MHDGKASIVQYRANGLAIHVLTKGRTDLGPPEFSESGRSKIRPKLKLEKSPKEKGLINSEAEFLKRNQPIELI